MSQSPVQVEWIDRHVTTTRITMYRAAANGRLYEDTYPHDPLDVEISHRTRITEHGTILGEHPDLGVVSLQSGQLPTTEMYPRPVE